MIWNDQTFIWVYQESAKTVERKKKKWKIKKLTWMIATQPHFQEPKEKTLNWAIAWIRTRRLSGTTFLLLGFEFLVYFLVTFREKSQLFHELLGPSWCIDREPYIGDNFPFLNTNWNKLLQIIPCYKENITILSHIQNPFVFYKFWKWNTNVFFSKDWSILQIICQKSI